MKWISVKDRLPDFNQRIIAVIWVNGRFHEPFKCIFFKDQFFELTDLGFANEHEDNAWTYEVTHWMDIKDLGLPEPPKHQ
ncbi:MAG: DUF551 domain-containing protein [Psychroserpens sp.]|nr:DUF551 domain-containing protein [Psychroserpens sp.]